MSDLDMLKAVVDSRAEGLERWDTTDEAVNAVLHVLYESAPGNVMWQPIYDALKLAYVGDADWGDA